MNKHEYKEALLTGAVIGDTLGRIFDGHSRGHVQAHIQDISHYHDPLPLLKGKTERWKKPGLYSSRIQLMILTALSTEKRSFDHSILVKAARLGLQKGPGKFGIFRTPASIEKKLFTGLMTPDADTPHNSTSTAQILPIVLPLAIRDIPMHDRIEALIDLSQIYNADMRSLTAALSLCHAVTGLLTETSRAPQDLIDTVITGNRDLLRFITRDPHMIFARGINPVEMEKSLKDLNELLCSIKDNSDIAMTEKQICRTLNTDLKSPITRATVDLPFALYPFALALVQHYPAETDTLLFNSVQAGGHTATLASLTGMLSTFYHGIESIPRNLIHTLVNKKNIFSLLHDISNLKSSQKMITDFIDGEAGLTSKEEEERTAKTRHQKQKKTHKKNRKEKEEALSRHVVESWTKLDKARWKKERKNLNNI